MPLLHMQTEDVQQTGQLLVQFASSIQSQNQSLHNAIQSLSAQWQGPASNQFVGQMEPLLQQLQQYSEAGNELHQRLLQEVAQWEETAVAFGDSAISSGIIGVATGDVTTASGSTLDYNPTSSTGTDFISGQQKSTGQPGDDDYTGFQANIWEGEVGVASNLGEINPVDGLTIGAFGYAAGASGSIGFNSDGFVAKGEAGAEAYILKGEYEKDFGVAKAKGDAQVGVKASAEGEIEINPLEGDLEFEGEVGAFIGASADGEVSTEIGPVGGSVGGEIGVGFGAQANMDAGFDDWKFNLDFGASAYAGVGGGVDFSVELDLPELAEGAMDIGEDVVESDLMPWNWF